MYNLIKCILVVFIFLWIWITYWYELNNYWYTPAIWQVKYYKRTLNVFYIPMWKVELFKQKNISYNDMLMYSTITNLECGKETWNCNNGADIWPFQFNQIHKQIVIDTKRYLKAEDYKWLYEYQLDLMIWRVNYFDIKCPDDEYWRLKCQLWRHNGSWPNGDYAKKGILIYNFLKQDKFHLKELYEWIELWYYNVEFDYIPFIDEKYTNYILLDIIIQ